MQRVSLSHTVPDFDCLGAVCKRRFQNALADGLEHQTEQPTFDVFAFAYYIHVNVGGSVGSTRDCVDNILFQRAIELEALSYLVMTLQ